MNNVFAVFIKHLTGSNVLQDIFFKILDILKYVSIFMFQGVTWLLIIGCLAAVAVSAPATSSEDSAE
jgi:hypothetical protein